MKKKSVITLEHSDLVEVMRELWEMIEEKHGEPDGIVGIATGGLYCAELLKKITTAPVFTCSMKRPATEIKEKFSTKLILKLLPYSVTDRLRLMEDNLLERKTLQHAAEIPKATDMLMEDLEDIVKVCLSLKLRHIVIIDDALDSGATMACVLANLKGKLPDFVKTHTAVITQTRKQVLLKPDFKVYTETLCRFPWSFDFRKKLF